MTENAFKKPMTGTVEDLRRLRQVVRILADEGLSLVVDGIRLRYLDSLPSRWRRAFRKRSFRKGKELPPSPVRLRRALERLGPTYVKFGQILSTRPDLIPADFVSELVRLQEHVRPVPSSLIRREAEKELGKPLSQVFSRHLAYPHNKDFQILSVTMGHRRYVMIQAGRKGPA